MKDIYGIEQDNVNKPVFSTSSSMNNYNISQTPTSYYNLPIDQQMASIGTQEPFKKTPEQQKYLDYLGQDLYNQNNQNQQYADYIRGQLGGDTLAQRQLADTTGRNISAATGQIGSTRGMSNPALLAGMAREQASNISQQGSQQADILKQQETQANLAGYGQALQTGANQDMLRQQLYGGITEQDRQANEDRMRLIQSVATEKARAREERDYQDQVSQDQFVSGVGQAGLAIGLAASDRKLKTNIASGDKQIDDYLESLNRYPNINPKSNSYLDSIG